MPHLVQRRPDQHHRRRALIRRGQRQAREHPLPRLVQHDRPQQERRTQLRPAPVALAQHEVLMRRAEEEQQQRARDMLVAAMREPLGAGSTPPTPATWR